MYDLLFISEAKITGDMYVSCVNVTSRSNSIGEEGREEMYGMSMPVFIMILIAIILVVVAIVYIYFSINDYEYEVKQEEICAVNRNVEVVTIKDKE